MKDSKVLEFMFVKRAKLKDAKQLELKSIKFEMPKTGLFKELEDLKSNGNISKLMIRANHAIESNEVFNTISDMQSEYLEQENFLAWLTTSLEEKKISFEDVVSKITKNKIDVPNMSKLWEALIIHSISDNPIGIVDLLVALIRLDKLIHQINKSNITSISEVENILNSNVILPEEIFPFKKLESTPVETDPPVGNPSSPNQEQVIDQIAHLESAKQELVKLYNSKLKKVINKIPTQMEYQKQVELSKSILLPQAVETEKDVALDDLEVKSETIVMMSESDNSIAESYQNFVAQDQTKRLTESDLNNLSKISIEAMRAEGIEMEGNVEISTLVKDIDETKLALSNSIVGGMGYTVSHISDGMEFSLPSSVDVNCLRENTGESYCKMIARLQDENPSQPVVNVLGIGEYKVVRQKLVKYEGGEIALIKNVFAQEEFERSHRDFKRSEATYESISELETEEYNEISTNDRFEVSKEVTQEQNKETNKELGATLSVGYGPIKLAVNGSYSTSASSSSSSKSASKYARETIEKATSKINEKITEKRKHISINEVEVINSYKLNNNSADHKVGVYLWVDKYYENQIYNIGKRLMLEFYIPSPMSFYMYSKSGAQASGVTVPKPIHPKENYGVYAGKALTSYKNITRENVDKWITAYNVRDFEAPPAEYINIQNAFKKSMKFNNTEKGAASFSEEISLPSDYVAKELTIRASVHVWDASDTGWVILVNNNSNHAIYGDWSNGPMTSVLPDIKDKFSLSGLGRSDMAVYINVKCAVSNAGFERWQISVFNAIMEAYENMKAEYDNQIALAQINSGVSVSGNNPEINKQIINEELQKYCVDSLLMDRFLGYNAMKKATNGRPEIDYNQVKKEQKVVSFMNSAFEWENLTYIPYAYFYNNKAEHPSVRNITNNDPKFLAILKAGYCRVIVPVTYGFEAAALHLINSGQVWNGGDLPVLGDPLFQSIVDEIKGEEYDNIGTPEGQPWITKVPTNHFWLRNSDPSSQL